MLGEEVGGRDGLAGGIGEGEGREGVADLDVGAFEGVAEGIGGAGDDVEDGLGGGLEEAFFKVGAGFGEGHGCGV